MKIALFAETYLPYINGVVTHIKVLKDGLTELGHEVLIVTADPNAKTHYIKDGVLHCPALAFKKLYGYGLANPNSRTRMKILREFNPDVLHMHQEFGVGYFSTLAAKRLGKPLVYTLHSMYDAYVFYVAPKPLVPAVRRLSHSYARLLAGRAAAITSPSQKALDFFKSCRVKKPVEVIPNSIDFDAFDPDQTPKEAVEKIRRDNGIPLDATVCMFVGRLGREKSVHVTLDYWARFFVDDPRLYMMIIGDGPERKNLEQQAKDLGITSQIKFIGRVDHSQIVPYFLACDIYLSASMSEMMSISMLEGMAAGQVAVLRNDPLNAMQIKEGVNGYNFDTPEEMADIIRSLASRTPDERRATRESVRESMRNAGSADLAKYMLSVYERVVNVPTEA